MQIQTHHQMFHLKLCTAVSAAVLRVTFEGEDVDCFWGVENVDFLGLGIFISPRDFATPLQGGGRALAQPRLVCRVLRVTFGV